MLTENTIDTHANRNSIYNLFISSGNDLTIGVTGLAERIALTIIIVAFYLYDSKISKEKIMRGKIGDFMN